MIILSNYAIPVIIFLIILYGYFKKINIYETFLEGCREGIKIVLDIFPAVIAMVFAISLLTDSNVLDFLLSPLLNVINIPSEVLSMALVRPISGTASMSLMTSIFSKYGVDSYYGFLSSVLQGCTDTTIYVIALYYSSIKVTKIRYTLIIGLMADAVGIFMAFFLTKIFF